MRTNNKNKKKKNKKESEEDPAVQKEVRRETSSCEMKVGSKE